MGKSTSVLANHNLDTSSLEKLAKDVAQRLGVSVAYGYEDIFDYEKFKENPDYDCQFEIVVLGTIDFGNSTKTYTLLDSYYQYKCFIEKYGLIELEKPYFTEDSFQKKEIIERQNAIEYRLEEDRDIELSIYRDTMDMWLVESLDWHYFQYFFIYKQDESSLQYKQEWRIENRDWIYKLGGDYMFVGCYEDNSAFLFDEAEYKTSEEIKALVAENYIEELVNIPNYIKAGLYLNKPEYDSTPLDRNFFRKMDHLKDKADYKQKKVRYSTIYYDDFHDLENSKIIAKAFDIVNDGKQILEQEAIKEEFINTFLIEHEVMELKIPKNCFLIYEGYISGLQHYSFFHWNMTMKINQELRLELEPKNKYDKNAIVVDIEDETQDKKLGYIAQRDNLVISKLLLNNQKLRCYLTAINEKNVEKNDLNKAVKIAIYFEK
jgi:hypothetical protein